MYCFWTGEMQLGGIDGVIKTEAGFYYGREVVKVWFDESELEFKDLVAEAAKIKCANRVYSTSKGKYALPNSLYKSAFL